MALTPKGTTTQAKVFLKTALCLCLRANPYNYSTQENEALQAQGQPRLHGKFQANLSYIMRLS